MEDFHPVCQRSYNGYLIFKASCFLLKNLRDINLFYLTIKKTYNAFIITQLNKLMTMLITQIQTLTEPMPFGATPLPLND